MTFLDLYDGKPFRLTDLKREWDGEESHECDAKSFRETILNVLMATVNGRNDLEITDMTPTEVSNLIMRLKGEII